MPPQAPGQGLAARVVGVAAWAPGVFEASQWRDWAAGHRSFSADAVLPQPSGVDAMLRRRLSPLARATLAVGERLLPAGESAQVVYASRHGDMRRTVELLDAIVTDDPLSPTTFSLSVHNALLGLWGIVRQDRSPTLALAAGEASFAWGLVEGMSRSLDEPDQNVILLYADEPLPGPYAAFEDTGALPVVMGIHFQGRGQESLRIGWEEAQAEASAEPGVLAFLRAWFGREGEGHWRAGERVWSWSRHAAA